ncbi:MAG: T9SS type A sorting domain-containing protein, partial [Bacteroidales bacterium]
DSLGDPIARIYPNPARDVIYVEFNGTVDVENIFLFAADGRKASDYQAIMQSSGFIIEIPQTFTGLYLLRIILKDGRVAIRKIIIR